MQAQASRSRVCMPPRNAPAAMCAQSLKVHHEIAQVVILAVDVSHKRDRNPRPIFKAQTRAKAVIHKPAGRYSV